MTAKLSYVIVYVDDIEGATGFYRDELGLQPRVVTPAWVELDTGATTLALHRADERRPSGTAQPSFSVGDVSVLHDKLAARGVKFVNTPEVRHGKKLAELVGPGGEGIGLSSDAEPHATPAHPHHPRFSVLAAEARRHIREIGAPELTALRERGPVVVVDVREESEWKQGRVPGALHIPRGVLEAQLEQAVPDLASQIVVYCAGGNRGALAAESLQKIGYAHVASLRDGFRGWREAEGPVETDK